MRGKGAQEHSGAAPAAGPARGVDGWSVIDSYFRSSRYRLTQHQLDSFDDFVLNKIPRIVRAGNPFIMRKIRDGGDVEVRVWVGGRDGTAVFHSKPTVSLGGGAEPLLPSMCRNLGAVYDSEVTADILVETDEARGRSWSTTFERVRLGRVPTMLHSSLCYLRGLDSDGLVDVGEDPGDPGGYFVVDGKEKVVVAQEEVSPNVPIVRAQGEGLSMLFRSAVVDDSVKPVEFTIYTRSRSDLAIMARVRALSRDVPLAMLFRMLGVETDRAIVRAVVGDRYDESGSHPRERMVVDRLRASLAAHGGVWTSAEALQAAAPLTPYKTLDHARYIILRHVLPGAGASLTMKALELGRLVRRLLEVAAGLRETTDRDSLAIKAVKLSGHLMAEVFAEAYERFRKSFRDELDRTYYFGPWNHSGRVDMMVNNSNIGRLADASIVTETMYKSFKGNWGLRGAEAGGGIVQDLNRLSYIGTLSHLRRVDNPISRDLKLLGPRRIHSTQWGFLCPSESPDGESVGLLKNLAVTCSVTSDTDPGLAQAALLQLGCRDPRDLDLDDAVNGCKVLVNGVWLFHHSDGGALARALRARRREGGLDRFTSVHFDAGSKELAVYTGRGRCVRPLLVRGATARPGGAGLWEAMVGAGEIEFLDVRECDNVLMSMGGAEDAGRPWTHREIHPSVILSVYIVTVPFLAHNPATRVTLSAAQGKQAASVFSTGFRFRADAMAFLMHYPELPIAHTRYEDLIGTREHPQGHNAVVAIMAFTGYNVEDAVILNRASLERGQFTTTYFKSVVHQEEIGSAGRVYFRSPGTRGADAVPSVDEDGFPFENAFVAVGQPLVGMAAEEVDAGSGLQDADSALLVSGPIERRTVMRDVSPVADGSWAGTVVDNVVVNARASADGGVERACRVRYRQIRVPEQGDKFASRHSQKGVVGLVLDPWEMPYTADGVVPDIVINPHGFPSRMTVGHLLECLVSKAGCLRGERHDATAFESVDAAGGAESELARRGFFRSGDEVMYSPATGFPLAAEVFLAPTFYQRLKHMSQDKLKARSSGRVSAVTRQPTGTVGSERPLKLGEMESAALVGHGIAHTFRESFMDRSDGAPAWVDSFGEPVAFSERDGVYRGIRDPEDRELRRFEVPYSFLVLQHELGAAGVGVSLDGEAAERQRGYHAETHENGSIAGAG